MSHHHLAAALAAEHAAIFAYGPIGVQLADDESGIARAAEAAHRARRDELITTLADRGLVPPPAEAAYELPFPVTDAESARELAILIETRVARVWQAVLPEVTAEGRSAALAALVDAAVRATGWRRAAGVEPATVPFPGEVESG